MDANVQILAKDYPTKQSSAKFENMILNKKQKVLAALMVLHFLENYFKVIV